ncbi:MAG: glycoside hydrolase family 3 C-terminal domain-containing protein [Acidobacteria bacterium]|nr:glycoside hydrolase family 3 C-terminal domain-containing protein [Acidobacteriota bacterium]
MPRRNLLFLLAAAALPSIAQTKSAQPQQPNLGTRSTPVLKLAGLSFKDLNRNGRLDPYEDWRLPIDRRVADLLARMSVQEKAGLMFHASISGATGPNGEVLDNPTGAMGALGRRGSAPPSQPKGAARAILGRNNPYNIEPGSPAPVRDLILQRNIRWAVIRPGPEAPEITAKFINNLQEIAESSRLGIPMTPSDNPRSGIRRSAMGVEFAGRPAQSARLSQWPGQLGMAAIGDIAAVQEHARITARELRAMGIRALLGPQADVATEPRWNRISGTFGDDFDWVAKLTAAFIEGFQGKRLGPESVLCIVKHFPGDGPVKDGYDPHSDYGKWAIYPANRFDSHLIPFQSAFRAGAGAVMGAYFIPTGKDTVAINFSKAMATGLLRDKLAFPGIMVTDTIRSMPWGVEHLSRKDQEKAMVLAGVDQILSESDPRYILECVKEGSIPAARLDLSARRILKAMFELGLFENPYVDPEQTKLIAGSTEFVAAGQKAQDRSLVLLKNSGNALPLPAGRKIFLQNLDRQAAAPYGVVVDDIAQADLSIIRITTPAIVYPFGGSFFIPGAGGGGRPPAASGRNSTPAAVTVRPVLGNTLAYTGSANQAELDAVLKLAATGKPVIVCVEMDRPTILTEFIEQVPAVLASFGVSDAALFRVIFGKSAPTGKLPFDLPSDMPSVTAQAADASHDFEDPLFKFGFGLTYAAK